MPVTKWEYKVLEIRIPSIDTTLESSLRTMESVLNKLGEEGWELVCYRDDVAILKRNKQGDL